MKKTIIVMLMLCLMTGSLFAAGQTEAAQGSEEVEISWYFPAFGGAQDNEDAVYEEVNRLLSEKIQTTVKFVPVDPGSYEQKMNTMMAAGEEFDICFTASWFNNYWQNVDKGSFVALDELVEQYAPNIVETIPSKYFDAARVGSKFYGLVNYQIIPVTRGFWVNTDILDDAGIDVKTLEKNWKAQDMNLLTPVFAAWKEKHPDTYPLHVGSDGGFNSLDFVLNMDIVQKPAAVALDDDALNVFNIYKSEQYKEYLNLMRAWYLAGYLPKNVVLGEGLSDFFKGEAAVYMDSNIKPLDKMPEYDFNYARVKISDPIISTGAVCATLNAISITSKNPDRAMMVLDLINSDKLIYNTLNYGIEGVNYNKVGENTMAKIPDTGYDPNIAWVFGNQFNSYVQEGGNPDIWEDTKAVNDSGVPTKTLGFVFDMGNISAEVTAVSSVIDEYANVLQTGSVDPDELYQKFIDKLDSAGAQIIIDETQRQLDAWKSSN